MKKHAWLLAGMIPILCIAIGLTLIYLARAPRATGHLKLFVVDAYSNMPIENATIVLPENNITAVTDKNGSVGLYGITLRQSGILEKMPPCDYGETTILAYAEGYLPFALFHAHVYPDRMRNGPTLYLFPEGTEDGINVVSMIESPNEEWVEELLKMYAP